jgi:hypothetical protein
MLSYVRQGRGAQEVQLPVLNAWQTHMEQEVQKLLQLRDVLLVLQIPKALQARIQFQSALSKQDPMEQQVLLPKSVQVEVGVQQRPTRVLIAQLTHMEREQDKIPQQAA